PIKIPRQLAQDLVDELPNGTQRVSLRHTLFRRHITEHRIEALVVSRVPGMRSTRSASCRSLNREWRKRVVKAARRKGLRLTHGSAPTLVIVSLNSVSFWGARHDHPRVRALHPPIDSLLLDALYP